MNRLWYKVILWRSISILITLFVMWVLTGDIKSASRFTIFLHFLLTGANYAFEKYWQRKFKNR